MVEGRMITLANDGSKKNRQDKEKSRNQSRCDGKTKQNKTKINTSITIKSNQIKHKNIKKTVMGIELKEGKSDMNWLNGSEHFGDTLQSLIPKMENE